MSKQCDCYPGGFSPGTYEGPMRDCPVHGECTCPDGDVPIGQIDGPAEDCPIHGRDETPDDIPGRHGGFNQDGYSDGPFALLADRNIYPEIYEEVVPTSGLADDWCDMVRAALNLVSNRAALIAAGEMEPTEYKPPVYDPSITWILEETSGRFATPYARLMAAAATSPRGVLSTGLPAWIRTVTDDLRSVTLEAETGLGGSKVGDEWFPVVPPQVRGQVAKIVSGAWKRTFGGKKALDFHDLKNLPHLSGSQWFPVVPGTTAGTWTGPGSSGSRSYRGNHSTRPFRGVSGPVEKRSSFGNHSNPGWGTRRV